MIDNFNKRAKLTLLVILSAACLGSSIISPCLPVIMNYFGVAKDKISVLVGIYLFGYLFGQIFYSNLSQKFGYKNSLKIGFLIYLIGAMLQCISIKEYNFILLCFSRFFCAFGSSSGLICSFAMMNEFLDSQESKKYIAFAFISLTLFSYLSITIGGIIGHYFGFKLIFYSIFCIALIQLFMIYIFLPDLYPPFKDTKNNFFVKYLKSIRNEELFLSSLIVAFTTTVTYLYNAIAPIISYNIFYLTQSEFGFFSIFNLLGLIIGGCIFSYLNRFLNIMNILFLGIAISTIPIISFYIFDQVIFSEFFNGLPFFILNALLNLGLGLIYPSASFISLNSIKNNSISSSIMNFIKIGTPTIILFIASQINYSLSDSFKNPLIFYFIIVVSCFIRLFYLNQRKTNERIIAL